MLSCGDAISLRHKYPTAGDLGASPITFGLFVLNSVENQPVKKFGVATIEIPAEVGLALFAGGNPPSESRKPAIGSHALPRDCTSKRLAETTQMKADAVGVGAVMIEGAIHFGLVRNPTDD